MIQDSGERRKFDSGAVRDIQEGKGRMDLLPLNQISEFIEYYNTTVTFTYGSAFSFIKAYINTRNCCAIYACIKQFMDEINLSLYDMIIELSKHYEEGALKYEDRNWEKAFPCIALLIPGYAIILNTYEAIRMNGMTVHSYGICLD